MTDPAVLTSVRLDVWLWAARFFKTRALSKEAIGHGKIRIGEQPVAKASRLVRVGDRLSIERAGERYELAVIGLAEQRGPAAQAQGLYQEDADSVARRALEREQRRLNNAGFSAPEQRPDKHARRKLKALRQTDGLPPWFPR